MILLDSSSSMESQIQGENKSIFFYDTLKKVLSSSPIEDLGLTLFGHRSLNSCQDVEMRLPSDNNHTREILSTLRNIKPKGKSPILYALKFLYAKMNIKQKTSHIILIASNADNCYPYPCAMAKRIKAISKDLRIDVLGISVNSDTTRQLSCIAKVTGGRYFDIQSKEVLKDVLYKVLNIQSKEIVKLQISATETSHGKAIPLYGYIYNKENRVWKVRQEKGEDALVYHLPLGQYHLSVEYASFMKSLDFEIKNKEEKSLELIMGQTGEIKITFTNKKPSMPLYGYIYARKENKKYASCLEQIEEKNSLSQNYRLARGKYILIIYYNKHQKELPFEINSEHKAHLFVDLDTIVSNSN